MTSEKTTKKRYSLLVLAVLLLVFSGAAFVLAPNSFAIRLLGLVAIVVSVSLVRASNVHRRPNPGVARGENAFARTGKRLRPIELAIGAGSALAAVASYVYLRSDALNGYHQVLPVYVFAGVGAACALIWGYLVARVLR